MKSSSIAAALCALTVVAAPLTAQPRYQAPAGQRGGAPNPDTPQILVSPFGGPTHTLAIEVSDEIRSRIQDEHSAKELFATTKVNIEKALTASGFPPDSALSNSDLMELAKLTHAEYVVAGVASKSGNTVHVESTMLTRTGRETLTQPLPPVDGKDPGDVAKMLERNISAALKGMTPYKACISDLREAKYDMAVKDGNLALTAYPNSTLARLCLLTAYDKQNLPDSVLSVANAILAKDSTNTIALANVADVLEKKGDHKGSAHAYVRISKLDPNNLDKLKIAINALVGADLVDEAQGMIKVALAQNPGDVDLLKTKMALHFKANQFKEAIATAEEIEKADPASVTVEFVNRIVGAAQKDSNDAKIVAWALRGEKVAPKDVSFPLLIAQTSQRMHQLPQAMDAINRAIAIDPKNTDAYIIAAQIAKEMNNSDLIVKLANQGIAAGADKTKLSQLLLGPVGVALKRAQETKARVDWEAALKAAQDIDATSGSPQTKFYIGVSSFYVGLAMLEDVQTLAKAAAAKKTEAPAACAAAKATEDMFAITATAMPAGGRVDPTAAAAVLNGLNQYGDYVQQVKKSFCK